MGLALGINQRSGDEQLLPHKLRPQSSWQLAWCPGPKARLLFSRETKQTAFRVGWGSPRNSSLGLAHLITLTLAEDTPLNLSI